MDVSEDDEEMHAGDWSEARAPASAMASDAGAEPRPTLTHHPYSTLPRPPPTMAPSEHNDSAAGAAPETPSYDPKPSLQYASAVGLQAAGIGALVSAVQNALGSHTSGAAGVFTRTGGTIGFFGASGVSHHTQALCLRNW